MFCKHDNTDICGLAFVCEELPEAENTQERGMQKGQRSSSGGLLCHSGCLEDGDAQRTSLMQPAVIILSVGTGAGG